jgi:hypothetical protein
MWCCCTDLPLQCDANIHCRLRKKPVDAEQQLESRVCQLRYFSNIAGYNGVLYRLCFDTIFRFIVLNCLIIQNSLCGQTYTVMTLEVWLL